MHRKARERLTSPPVAPGRSCYAGPRLAASPGCARSTSSMALSSLGRLGRRCEAGDKGRRLLAEPAIEDAAQRAAEQGRNPEQPQLREGPAADEQGRTG